MGTLEEKPLISVIVPVYNAEKYLKQCVESILNQTYQNIELILIDDGSTDNSLDICNRYKKADNRVKVITQKNAGAAAARNAGLAVCKGDYLGFVDSDDYIDNDMYDILYDACKRSELDVAQIWCIRVTEDGHKLESQIIHDKMGVEDTIYTSEQAIINFMTGNHSMCTKLYKAHLFKNISLAEGITAEDIAIIIPLYANANGLIDIKQYKYNYRINSNSVTHSELNDRDLKLIEIFEELFQKYSDNELYRKLIAMRILSCTQGIINAILKTNQYIEKEPVYRERLRRYYKSEKNNEYVSKAVLKKIRLYLSCRFLYKMMLKVKTRYYHPSLY